MRMLQFIRNSYATKVCSLVLAILMLEPITGLKSLKAASGGPTQPEYNSFTAVSASNLVDPFTGNVGYNVPLFEIGGYPVTLSYSGDIGMEQDAGWVGLGWSLNMGSITRGLRGVPDEFNGTDEIEQVEKMRPRVSVEVDMNTINSEMLILQKGTADQSNDTTMVQGKTLSLTLGFDNYTGLFVGFRGLGKDLFNFNKDADTLSNSALSEKGIYKNSKKKITDNLAKSALSQFSMSYDSRSGIDASQNLDFLLDKSKLLQKVSTVIGLPTSVGLSSRSGKISTGLITGFPNSKYAPSYSPDFTYNPTFITPISNLYSFNNTTAFDFSIPGVAGNTRAVSIKANVSGTFLRSSAENTSFAMYGLMYMKEHPNLVHQQMDAGKIAIFDVQENGKYVDKYTTELSSSAVLADVFSIAGAGVGGSFRLQDNALTLHGPGSQQTKPSVNSIYLKGELGSQGATSEVGVDAGVTVVRHKYEPLSSEDFENSEYYFDQILATTNNPYQPVSFKNDFEFIESSNAYYSGFHWDTLTSIGVRDKFKISKPGTLNFHNKFKNTLSLYPHAESNSNVSHVISSHIRTGSREARQQVVTHLKANEAMVHSFQKKIVSYDMLVSGQSNASPGPDGEYRFTPIEAERVGNSGFRKGHHISEFTVLQPDGSTHYYGTPAYNYSQTEYEFNVSSQLLSFQQSQSVNNYNYLNNTTGYTSNDISDNNKGIDHRKIEKKIPSYAHAFLLNAVLSSDYVDVNGDGPSKEDIGNYVKFNYSLAHGDLSSTNNFENTGFKWRNLSGSNKADLSIANKSDLQDDKASFTYGVKENWYIHSIETKDQIALFYLKKRLDGYEVLGSNGGVNFSNGKQQYYLDHVAVYSLEEFRLNGEQGEPLKVVHLQYSYDLCQGYDYNVRVTSTSQSVINPDGNLHPITGLAADYNRGGKLTLHKVWVTYGKQNIPTSAPYVFEYKTLNPNYEYKAMDRWGNFQPLKTGSNSLYTLNSQDHPYTNQNATAAGQNASAWMLSDIQLPSGGKITIDYESDSYGHVQNRKAMNMLKITAITDHVGYDENDVENNHLFTSAEKFTFDNPRRVYLIVEKPSGVNSVNQLVDKDELLYYNFMVQLGRQGLWDADKTREPINGFCEIESIGEINSQYSYIKLKHEMAGMWAVNPIVRNALQQGLARASFIFYPGSDQMRSHQTLPENKFISMLLGSITETMAMLTNKYQYFMTRNFCRTVDLNQCFIRTLAPSGTKLGGGHRVKSVTITDNWSTMTSAAENSASYTIDYTYNNTDGSTSGVANYEPLMGGDENPLKYPKTAYKKKWMSKKVKAVQKTKEKQGIQPSNHSYDLGPVGEEFFPSPVVGYGRVTTKTRYPNSDIKKHKTGYTVQEFYTAKDFPVISEASILERRQSRIGDIGKGVGNKKVKGKFNWKLDVNAKLTYTVSSQGFTIELNDMHGKPKSNLVYTEDDNTPFSGSRYYYKTDEYGNLVNNIQVIRENGNVQETQAGLNIEPILFGSQSSNVTHSIRPNVDLDFKGTLLMPGAHLGYNLNRDNAKSITFTKLIRRSGIVDSVVVYDKGAATSIKNIAWDALTGQVILSSVKNEYSDVVYSLTKPAHWMYKGIQGAYQNIGLTVDISVGISGETTNNSGLLFPGDELISTDLTQTQHFWVLDRNDLTGKVSLIDQYGNPVAVGNYTVKVLRSGLKNILGAGAETITLKASPINLVNGKLILRIPVDQVIAGKGITFDDRRMVYRKYDLCFDASCPTSENGSEPSSSQLYSILTNFQVCDSGTAMTSVCMGGGHIHNKLVNPFRIGIKGVWKPYGDYAYHDKRNQFAERTQTENLGSYNPNTTNVRYDGLIKNYREFWYLTENGWASRTETDTSNPWTWTETLEQTDELGNHVQSKNALNIYSAALYGFNDRRLVIATAANAKHQEIIAESFEDISPNPAFNLLCLGGPNNYPTGGPNAAFEKNFCGPVRNWPVAQLFLNTGSSISTTVSHTGWKSLKLAKGNNPVKVLDNPTGGGNNNSDYFLEYRLKENDFIEIFKPVANKPYILTLWVKENTRNQFELKITDGVNTYSPSFETTSIIINGWKKLSYRFIPTSSEIDFLFVNNGVVSSNDPELQYCFLDDIRVQPAESAMQAFVYDWRNYRIMSTLDDNNFAVFFEYDEEGALVRKKVETERGIMTIDENRNSLTR